MCPLFVLEKGAEHLEVACLKTFLLFLERPESVQDLRYGLLNFLSLNHPAQFVLLQSPRRLPGESEEESRQAAREALVSARSFVASLGLSVIDGIAGDPLPRKALTAEMTRGRHVYDGIVMAGRPSGFLRFLPFDLSHQLERKFHVPVSRIEAESPQRASAA
jgi:hypothetical protein